MSDFKASRLAKQLKLKILSKHINLDATELIFVNQGASFLTLPHFFNSSTKEYNSIPLIRH